MKALESAVNKGALSRITFVISIAIVAIIVVSSVVAASSTLRTQNTTNKISLEALNVSSSTSNITADINVARNTSNLVRMSLFLNGTFMGSYNFTGRELCLRIMHSWPNGTYSYYFTATPYSMPMMSRFTGGYGSFMTNRTYMITIISAFANGEEFNSTSYIYVNQRGMGSMMR